MLSLACNRLYNFIIMGNWSEVRQMRTRQHNYIFDCSQADKIEAGPGPCVSLPCVDI